MHQVPGKATSLGKECLAAGPGCDDSGPGSLAIQPWVPYFIRGIGGGKRCSPAFMSSPNGRITI